MIERSVSLGSRASSAKEYLILDLERGYIGKKKKSKDIFGF